MEKFEEQIKILVELQGLDKQIFKLEAELEAVPIRIKDLDEQYQEKARQVKAREDAIKTLQLKRKDKEGDLEAREGNIKKLKAQQYQVKTNKEYSAIQLEIDRAKADNSLLEEEIIRILDGIDAEHAGLVTLREELTEEEKKIKAKKDTLLAESTKNESELQGLRAVRKTLAEKVEKNLLARYERLLKTRSGLAIVPLIGEACQGCNRVLPPQVVNEVRMNRETVTCEYCTRMLYFGE